ARKNRSGELMESIVENIFRNNGVVYQKQVKSSLYPELHSVLGGDSKVFDFVVTTPNCKFLIEVNFYHGGGSKPNETARSYTELAPKINSVDGYRFVWITDGVGWKSAKAMFNAAYNVITPYVYNLQTIQNFINNI
ncbi:MAG: restriction endonuclease, partial [Alistipes sp.]|nr:restriction endonuclease [Alistipes sp.]